MRNINDIEMVVMDNTRKNLLSKSTEEDKLDSALKRAKGFF